MTLTIGGVEIGSGQPCRFVAELGNASNGDFHTLLRLIDAAVLAGADFVKFQCYTPDELVALRGDGPAPGPWGSQGWTMRTLYEKARTPLHWFPALAEYCAKVGIPWFSSVFGAQSLAVLEACGCPVYKIARLDAHHTWLTAAAGWHTEKPLIVSWDGTGDDPRDNLPSGDIEDGGTNVSLLYCPQGYPQSRFQFGRRWSVDFPDFLGFSYHGTSIEPPIVAATLGAKIIEAHFQLDDEPSELEANVSLTQTAFREMVRRVREVERMLA